MCMQIFVKTPRDTTIIIDVESTDTLLDVKKKIQEKEDIPVESIRAIYGSKQLCDNTIIMKCCNDGKITWVIKPLKVYSDHLPQLFDLDVDGLTVKAITYNIAATGQPIDGYVYSNDTEILNYKFDDEENRLNRILRGIKTMVNEHGVDLVALQEAPFIRTGNDQKSKHNSISSYSITKHKIENATGLSSCYVNNNMWLLYKKNKIRIKYPLKDQNKNKYMPKGMPIQQLQFIVKKSNALKKISCKLNIVHISHQDEPFEHEDLIRGLHENSAENIITIGDFNCGIDPSQLSGLVPAKLIDQESVSIEDKAYDFTDGCVFSGPGQSVKFIQGKCLNPETGKEYKFKLEGKFEGQAYQRRFRALVTLDGDECAENKRLEKKFQGLKVFNAYDIQEGCKVKALAFPNNSGITLQDYQLPEETNLAPSSNISWPKPYDRWLPMENYKVYFVKPSLLINKNDGKTDNRNIAIVNKNSNIPTPKLSESQQKCEFKQVESIILKNQLTSRSHNKDNNKNVIHIEKNSSDPIHKLDGYEEKYGFQQVENIIRRTELARDKKKSYLIFIIGGIMSSLAIGLTYGYKMLNWKTALAIGGFLFLLSLIVISAYFYKKHNQNIAIADNEKVSYDEAGKNDLR